MKTTEYRETQQMGHDVTMSRGTLKTKLHKRKGNRWEYSWN